MGQGALGRLAISASATFTGGSGKWFEFISETITKNVEYANSAGMRGTRQHCSERTRTGKRKVSGSITFELERELMDNLLSALQGANESSDIFDPAETIPDVYFLIDKLTDIVLVSEAKVGKMTIDGEQGQIVRVTFEIEAEDMTGGQSWPASTYPKRGVPYLFSDLGDVTLVGETREPARFSVSIDNVLDGDTFLNNLTRDETIFATDRIVTASLSVLATTANAELLNTGTAVTGEAVSIVLTNAESASDVFTIALGRFAAPPGQVQLDGKGTKLITLEGQSRALKHPGEGSFVNDCRITNAHAA